MVRNIKTQWISIVILTIGLGGCTVFNNPPETRHKDLPGSYSHQGKTDSTMMSRLNWKQYYTDSNLIALIDTALLHNNELNIMLQEIEISKSEVRTRKGEYLPFIGLTGSGGSEKSGKYTRNGAVEKNIDIKPGTPFPEPVPDYLIGTYASWEIDVWKKLRNAKKSAVSRYLASQEGKNFMVTNLVAEIAKSYYELVASDNIMEIINDNIDIQSRALQIVIQQKNAGKATQLAVNRFEAQLLNTQNLQYDLKQQITETENRINFLMGRFPQPIKRNSKNFIQLSIDSISSGIPSQLLLYRPDIRRSEYELYATKLDVLVARANFYPSFRITAHGGFQAFNPSYLIHPESFIFSLAGDLMAPLVNRNAIKAAHYRANAKQIQAMYEYEQTVLNAYVEVVNQLAKVENYNNSYQVKQKEVDLLNQSVLISNNLYNSGRADYLEVLLTQREVLDATIDQIEIKLKQMNAKVDIYKVLGGGWEK